MTGIPKATISPIRTARHFTDGFREGFREDRGDLLAEPPLWAGLAADLFMVFLFGLILTSPGVPLLPWGEPAGIAAALVATAGVLLLRLVRGHWLELVLLAFVFGCSFLAARHDGVSTSMLLAGAAIAAMTQTAKERPILYGFAAGGFLFGLAIQIFDLRPFGGVELIFSGEPFSPEAAGRQATLVAAVVLLAGMQQLAAREIRREKQRTEAAERAAEQAATDERARIAREFHDVVSHHVTAMTLQAEAAVATGDRAVLESLANSGREAAAELRRMLGVLRHPAEESPTQPPDPQPRLSDLDTLARRLSGGVEVTVERTGEPRPLPAGVELCAYRVIQEALTNVAKHSDARQASVAIDYAPRRLKIEVLDDGQPVQRVRESGGNGLIGMRERVSLLDGELEVGPRQGHRGYRVFASIPL